MQKTEDPRQSIYQASSNTLDNRIPNQSNFKERRHSVIIISTETGPINLEAQKLAGKGGGNHAVRIFSNATKEINVVIKSSTDVQLSTDYHKTFSHELSQQKLKALEHESDCFKQFYPHLCGLVDGLFTKKTYTLNDDTHRVVLPLVPGVTLENFVENHIDSKEKLIVLIRLVLSEWFRLQKEFSYIYWDFHLNNVLIHATPDYIKAYFIDFEGGEFAENIIEKDFQYGLTILFGELSKKFNYLIYNNSIEELDKKSQLEECKNFSRQLMRLVQEKQFVAMYDALGLSDCSNEHWTNSFSKENNERLIPVVIQPNTPSITKTISEENAASDSALISSSISSATEPLPIAFEAKIRQLEKYVNRIESHKKKEDAINFSYGFSLFAHSRAINRNINYLIAKEQIRRLKLGKPVSEVCGKDIMQLIKHEIVTKQFPKASGLTVSRGINSHELNSINKLSR